MLPYSEIMRLIRLKRDVQKENANQRARKFTEEENPADKLHSQRYDWARAVLDELIEEIEHPEE